MEDHDTLMDTVDELLYLTRNGVSLTADQEMAAQELGINISELRRFTHVLEPFDPEEEAEAEEDPYYDY